MGEAVAFAITRSWVQFPDWAVQYVLEQNSPFHVDPVPTSGLKRYWPVCQTNGEEGAHLKAEIKAHCDQQRLRTYGSLIGHMIL